MEPTPSLYLSLYRLEMSHSMGKESARRGARKQGAGLPCRDDAVEVPVAVGGEPPYLPFLPVVIGGVQGEAAVEHFGSGG